MNQSQKYIIIAGVFVFIMIGAVPPWIQTFDNEGVYSEEPLGYHPIIAPPKAKSGGRMFGVKVDISRLFIQWIVVLTSTTALVIVYWDKPQKKEK